MKIVACEQYSPEWYNARMGKPTSSNFHRILTPTGQLSKQSIAYMYKLLAERLLMESMQDQLGFVEWVERGKIEQEHAAAQFQFTHNVQLQKVGFVTNDAGTIGCSPDYITGNRCVEVKCPAPWTHLMYLGEGPGNDYEPQVQGQLFIGEWECAHFYSYHPRMPPVDLVIRRHEDYIAKLNKALANFLEQMETKYEWLKRRGAFARLDTARTPLESRYNDILIPSNPSIELPE